MNISDFVAELESQGIELWREDERLCFRAPGGIMTEQRKQQLREHKTELLAFFAHDTREHAIVADSHSRFDPFPLTETQQAWFIGRHGEFAFGGVACRGFLEVSFASPIEPPAIEQALQQLIERHDMLRVVVEEEGYQRVLAKVPHFPLPVTDLSSKTGEGLQAELDRKRDTMLAAPTDYSNWPLFAANAVKLTREVRLLLTVELIAVDAVSLYLLLDELEQLLFRPQEREPAPGIGFRDYVIAHRAAQRSRRYRQDRLYWLERLDALAAAPVWPLVDTLSGVMPDKAPFVRRQWRLSDEQRERLDQLASGLHVTLNVLLLGAFSQVLAFYAQSRCFTLNVPVFRRDARHADIERVVGDFTDVALLEVDLRGTVPFGHQLQAISQGLCDAMDHGAYSGLDVLRELSRRRGEQVLMPVVFTSTLGQGTRHGAEAAGYHIVRGLTQTPQVLIDCQVVAQPDGMLLAWDTREAYFPAQMIEQAFDLFCGFINRLLEEGDHCLQQSRPLTLCEPHNAVRKRVNHTYQPDPPALLHQGILHQAQARPDATAIIDTEGTLSFAQLVTKAQALATRLQQHGHQPGEPVAVLCAKGRGQAIAPLAILLCGGCYVPIALQQPAFRRDAMLRDAGIRWVICDDEPALADGGADSLSNDWRAPAYQALPAEITCLSWRCGDSPDACHTIKADGQLMDVKQPAYIIYTSGSTGAPKGVVVAHSAAWNTLADINRRFNIGPDDSILALASLSFDLSVYDLFGVLAQGGRLIYPDDLHKDNPTHWADLIQRHGISLWNSVPAQLQMLCDVAQPLSPLRLALVSGDWVPCDLHSRLHALNDRIQLVALGGATEAAIWSVLSLDTTPQADWKSVPYGTPLANQRLAIVDEQGDERPDWAIGQIAIAGEGLALGYWQDPDKTAARFITHSSGERRYLTGDRGRYRPDGRIEFLGRADDQVKIRGHRVELGEIAAVMCEHPAVAESVALLTPEGQLQGFAEIASGAQPAATSIFEAASQCALAAEQRMDVEAFTALMVATDQVAVLSMATRLRADGLFVASDARHSLEEIYQATQVASTYRRLLRQWLHALVSAGALRHDKQGRYTDLLPTEAGQLQQVWQQIAQLEQHTGYGSQTLEYIRVCSDDLAGLLRGERDVRGLLFPQGQLATAQAAYRDNLVSRSMNAIVIATLTQFAAQRAQPLRILEVGAGVAGTASDLVPALAEYRPSYWFTDLSTFFLTEARKYFAAYRWMRYGIFDINQPAAAQGMAPNSMDVILCANVLHNARHASEVLARFATMLAPGGLLVFIEPVRRHNYPLLVSMEFFPELTGFTDSRATSDQTFFTREQWLELLLQSGATLIDCLPQADNALAASGQGVFIAQYNTDRASLNEAQLYDFVSQRLPAHMVPNQLHLLDRLPRNSSGKIDRRALLAELPPLATTTSPATVMPERRLKDDLERAIASVWTEVLDIPITTSDANFYDCGGDSLLLSRMIGRLRHRVAAAQALTWGTLLRHLLQTPTLSALATLLRTAPSETMSVAPRPSPLVPLWGGDDRHQHCCVLLHAGSGDLQPYQALLGELDKSSFARGIGVVLPDVNDFLALAPQEALTQQAARYADALSEQGISFTLMGYCLGGLLAAEIARQLTERGLFVRELVVISTWQPPRVDDDRLLDFIFARALGANLTQLGMPQEPALAAAVNTLLRDTPTHIPAQAFDNLPSAHSAVGEALTRWIRRPLEERLAALQAASQGAGVYPATADDAMPFTDRYALFRHCMAAVGQYQPDPWMGKTVLVRNRASQPLLPGSAQEVSDYWRQLCLGELIITETPGDHFSCLAREHAAELAARIARHTQAGGRR